MMNQKQKREVKQDFNEHLLATFEMEGFTVRGLTKEGVAIQKDGTEDWVEIKSVVKNPEVNDMKQLIAEKTEDDARKAQALAEKLAKDNKNKKEGEEKGE